MIPVTCSQAFCGRSDVVLFQVKCTPQDTVMDEPIMFAGVCLVDTCGVSLSHRGGPPASVTDNSTRLTRSENLPQQGLHKKPIQALPTEPPGVDDHESRLHECGYFIAVSLWLRLAGCRFLFFALCV